jgi:hypothetical protein
VLTVELDCPTSSSSTFELRTPWVIASEQGATVEAVSSGDYRFTVGGSPAGGSPSVGAPGSYRHAKVAVTFAAVD